MRVNSFVSEKKGRVHRNGKNDWSSKRGLWYRRSGTTKHIDKIGGSEQSRIKKTHGQDGT